MENINLKAVLLAFILLLFTYKYYVREPGSILSAGTAVALGLIAIIVFFAYFFGVKIISYAICTKIYPHLALRILLPFVVITLLSWLVYAFIYVKPFSITGDFLNIIKAFFNKQVLFIVICTVTIGLILSFPFSKVNTDHQLLLRSNLTFLAITISVFIICILLFYVVNKIKQPSLDVKYKQYKNLHELQSSGNYEVSQLMAAEEYNYVEKPYLLPYKDELIITSTYGSNDTKKPIQSIYRLNKDGDIVEKIYDHELTDGDFSPIIFVDGILTDYSGKELITWIFDGNKKRQLNEHFMRKDDWVIDTLNENSEQLKMVYFQKTSKLFCNNNKEVKYNGTKYYEVMQQKELLKIKIDSIYSHYDNSKNCAEKKLDYYSSDRLNFSLLRLNEHEYYIIKAK